jgi:hypothetical protein
MRQVNVMHHQGLQGETDPLPLPPAAFVLLPRQGEQWVGRLV